MDKRAVAILGILLLVAILVISIIIILIICTLKPNNYERECEDPDDSTVGALIYRSNASGGKVYGQFGCESASPWGAQKGYVKYSSIQLHATEHLYMTVRYSKDSPSTTLIYIHLDDETVTRASFLPENQGDWNSFNQTEKIDLGGVTEGIHSIKFSTRGQKYGVADLDKFTLT